MQIKEIENFIWDFDGTLFDTYPYTIDCFVEAGKRFGFEQDRMELYGWLMQTIPYARKMMCEKFGLGEEFVEAYHELVESQPPVKRGDPFPYAFRCLEAIQKAGKHNFIFTHRTNDVYDFLDHYGIGHYFDKVLTLSDGVKPKPAPDAIYFLIEQYGLDPEKTIMIGDRELDVQSGINAGVKTCHITNRLPYTEFDTDIRLGGLDEFYELI